MRKWESWVLLVILIGAFFVRLYRFNNPIADWHSWRQADTSAVSRNFVKYGFDLLHPRFDDLSNVPSGKDNPQGYRFVEFPIYNFFQAGLFEMFGGLGVLGLTLEQWGRLVTIFSSLLSTIFLFLIVRKHQSSFAGFLAAIFFAFLPYNIYYGRVILPDTSMVAAILGGVYFFDLWIERSFSVNRHSGDPPAGGDSRISNHQRDSGQARMTSRVAYLFCMLSIILTSSALLLKPYAIFFTLPMVYLAFEKFGFSFLKKWQLWVFLVLSILPLILWRVWMLQYPEGIPVSAWLLNGGNIRFKGAFFYWIFADRMSRLILGYWGLPLLVLGFLAIYKKTNRSYSETRHSGLSRISTPILRVVERFWMRPSADGLTRMTRVEFFISFLVSSLLYLTIIARGNVQHDYYQILIIPSLVIFLGLGSEFLLRNAKEYFSKIACYILFAICFLFSLMFGWYGVRDYFNINHPSIVVAGEAVDKLIPKNAKIIANYNGDTSFLYQTKRQGWASFEKPIPEMISKLGADYLVLLDPTKQDLEGFGRQYKIVSYSTQYLLLQLH